MTNQHTDLNDLSAINRELSGQRMGPVPGGTVTLFSLNFPKIEFQTLAFTQKVSKPSPKL